MVNKIFFVIPCFLPSIVSLMTYLGKGRNEKNHPLEFLASIRRDKSILREIKDYLIQRMNTSKNSLKFYRFAIDQIVLWERKEVGFSVNVILLTRSCSCLTGTRLNCKFMHVRVWHARYLGYYMLLSSQLMRWRIYFILVSLSWTMCYSNSINNNVFSNILWRKNVCSEISNWLLNLRDVKVILMIIKYRVECNCTSMLFFLITKRVV